MESNSVDHGRRKKTGELVAGVLRRQIARGDFAVGDRLPSEDELAEHFGIARTTLREALRILESQRLIEIRRGRSGGPVVTMPDLPSYARRMAELHTMQGTSVADLDRARAMIEPHLAAELARHHTDDDLEALRDAVAAAETAANRGDLLGFARAAVIVHETLVERAGGRALATLSGLLHELVAEYYVGATLRSDGDLLQRAVRSYWGLVRLIDQGDPEGAQRHWAKQMAFTADALDQAEPSLYLGAEMTRSGPGRAGTVRGRARRREPTP